MRITIDHAVKKALLQEIPPEIYITFILGNVMLDVWMFSPHKVNICISLQKKGSELKFHLKWK